MNISKVSTSILMLTLLFLGSCKAGKETASSVPVLTPKMMNKGGEDVRVVPKATVFKMSGDYADKVAVTLNTDGTLAYYPDPSDITASSAPFPLGNGWYLNRQGIGPNSVFTSYSFEEFRNMKNLPSQQEIISAVIPGARVTEFMELPVSYSEAVANPQICIQYLNK